MAKNTASTTINLVETIRAAVNGKLQTMTMHEIVEWLGAPVNAPMTRGLKKTKTVKPATTKPESTRVRRTGEVLADVGQQILGTIKSAGKNGIQVGDIRSALGLDKSAVTTPLAKLREDGIVRREGEKGQAKYFAT